MVVCFSVGASSEGVAKKLEKLVDNAKFYTYSDIESIVKDAKLRHINYNRIIISNAIIHDVEEDLRTLNSFIKDYSSNTEIIMLLNGKYENKDEAGTTFLEMFNSPMYACFDLEKTTVKVLSDITTKEILELNEHYKSSIYRVTKENSKIENTSSGNINTNEDTSFSSEMNSNENQDNSSGNLYNYSSNMSETNLTTNKDNYEVSNNSNFSSGVSGLDGNDFSDDLNIDFEEELSLGSFGSSHSDTGFLYEEEEDLKEFKESRSLEDIPKEDQSQGKVNTSFIKPLVQPKMGLEESTVGIQTPVQSLSTNIEIIISPRNYNVSQKVIDMALNCVNLNRMSALVVDLDYKQNDILSYINTSRFYKQGYNVGITNCKVYMEDGVGVISNGYGLSVTESDVSRLLTSKVISQYEKVFVYCPVDCIDVLSMDAILISDISLYVGNCVSSYISISLGLSNRSKVNLEREYNIIKKSKVVLENTKNAKEELKLFSDMVYFTNISWVDRI